MDLESRPITKADYDEIVRVIDRWWGGPTSALAHPVFFYELGRHARVVMCEGMLVGFLFGFVANEVEEGPVGYVHLIGIHPGFRRRGVARLLYASFEEACRSEGVRRLKAITTLGNEGSVRFHDALGWTKAQLDDYAGPGRGRIVFTKQLAER